jgi:hypothetical protein
VVRLNGRVFELLQARYQRRAALDLYHAALHVTTAGARFSIEMAPAWGQGHGRAGVVGEGPVGLQLLGHSRWFRYEVRRWRDGSIPDLAEAVGGPQCVTDDHQVAGRVLDLVPSFPTATWGRDEFGTGDMWNSNSLVAWLLARAGVPTHAVAPPPHGRAPGWLAGLTVAARQAAAQS